MKILFASRYVDPVDPRTNKNILRQAKVLQNELDIDIEILTWPHRDLWVGALPEKTRAHKLLNVTREGLSYQIFICLEKWNEMAGGNVISRKAWEDAVNYGMNMLRILKPDIVHLHHRFGFWWMLDSAQRLAIPTVYSNYDWGMACLRSVLVNDRNELCDGIVEPGKCATCIKKGRTRKTGIINEALAESPFGETMLPILDQLPIIGEWLHLHGGVCMPACKRTKLNHERVTRVIGALGHCITPSEFGKRFFKQFGIDQEKISVMPWYHDAVKIKAKNIPNEQPFTMTYIGRVSPEKGIHLILEALENLKEIQPIILRIAGADSSNYCVKLKEKYRSRVHRHSVEWFGWSPIDNLLRTTDITIIPSSGMDNTPLTLLEAIAYRTPIITTRIASTSDLVNQNCWAYLFEFNSVPSLSMAIKNAVSDKILIREEQIQFPRILSAYEYCRELKNIYSSLLSLATSKYA